MKTDTVERDETHWSPRRARTGKIFLGLLLILGGVGWLLEETGVVRFDLALFMPVALMAVGLALVVSSRSGSHGGLVALGIVLTVLLTLGFFDDGSPRITIGDRSGFNVNNRVGERVERPQEPDDIKKYDLKFGTMLVDLTRLDAPSGLTMIEAEVGMGELTVLVPEDVPFRMEAKVNAGDIVLEDRRRKTGTNVEDQFTSPGFSTADEGYELDLQVGFGTVEVRIDQ